MPANKEIVAGAKAIAEDFRLPGGGRKMLARVVGSHLAWFDAVEARGMTWADISQLLLAAGAKSKNGRALSVGTLSSTVWRKRNEAEHQDKRHKNFRSASEGGARQERATHSGGRRRPLIASEEKKASDPARASHRKDRVRSPDVCREYPDR
jgi:hypothetical protein